ncbi:outer membrane efflux protein [Arenicella chitinivorans]|uniref:Outer membrane efflux protein n=1 Tax=Arenicella chitinivorans TaxID=1329800 RepID=A0A918RZR3_9GAMM|nr:efflux transporter outer membrane subunit [Arenicella chitinivorans]GHA17315.1 outer membrane efflux protein [Arenicella chitinivorans]
MTRFGVIFIVLSLSACQLAPKHVRPDLPVPQNYAAEDEPANKTYEAMDLDWRELIQDSRLEALIDAALSSNRDLRVAVERVEEARAAYGIARADRLPTLALSASGQRARTSSALVGEAAGVSEQYGLSTVVSAFELDFWGRVRNTSASARNNYLATAEAARAFQLSLMRSVTNAYLSALEAEERVALAEATVDARREQLRIADRRLAAGVTSELEFRQAQTLLTQAEAELAALRLAYSNSQNLLTVLIGGSVDEALPPGLPLGQQLNALELDAGLPSELLERRPDLHAAERRLIAARANIGAARAAFFPSIRLTASYGYASAELDDLVGSDARAWSYGPSIDLPIFDLGRRRANLDATNSRERIALAEYEKAIQVAFQEVADALAARRFLAEQLQAQQRGIVAQRRLAELAKKRYEEGVVRYIEVLDAERNLFAAEQALLQVRRIQTANLLGLYVALGGGLSE